MKTDAKKAAKQAKPTLFEPVTEGEYGAVQVMRGKHSGKYGLYDDDEGSKAVVYLDGAGPTGPYVMVPRKDLRSITEEEARRHALLFGNGAAVSAAIGTSLHTLDKVPVNRFPAFVALNNGPDLPTTVSIEESSHVTRSYFENRHREQWVAVGGVSGLCVTGGDIGWERREIFFKDGVTPEQVRDEVLADLASPMLPRFNLVVDKAERLWLAGFLSALAERVEMINNVAKATPA